MINMNKNFIKQTTVIVQVLFMLVSCATPVSYTTAPMSRYDKDTEYSIEDRQDGFYLSVYYSRYQFVPESSAVATACKQALTALAWEIAEKKDKQIDPVNEQRIRISMGRNGFSGITSCQASVDVKWKQ